MVDASQKADASKGSKPKTVVVFRGESMSPAEFCRRFPQEIGGNGKKPLETIGSSDDQFLWPLHDPMRSYKRPRKHGESAGLDAAGRPRKKLIRRWETEQHGKYMAHCRHCHLLLPLRRRAAHEEQCLHNPINMNGHLLVRVSPAKKMQDKHIKCQHCQAEVMPHEVEHHEELCDQNSKNWVMIECMGCGGKLPAHLIASHEAVCTGHCHCHLAVA